MGSESKEVSAFRSGYVSIVGRPNVGKSTFLNAVLGRKVSIVTPKPQTTRNRIIGIKTLDDCQMVFIDTPGIHRPRDRFGQLMVREAKAALKDVDLVLFMVEPRRAGEGEKAVIKLLGHLKSPVFLLINKVDKIKKPALLPVMEEYSALYGFDRIIPVSALKGEGLDVVVREAKEYLPPGPKYYPDELYTDQIERFMASETIREKVMELTEEEVPHAAAVDVFLWEEREGGVVFIGANIYVEREGQKGIIIGKRGGMLKAIGTAARPDIEGLLNTRVFLDLRVKVKRKWRTKEAGLAELGYK